MPSQIDIDFGKIAIQHKLITEEQYDEAVEALEKLERQSKGKDKQPRLVDVLVQKEFLDKAQAASVEKARNFRALRLEDKLYGRIAIKSKFVKPKYVEKGLAEQKSSYQKGENPTRLSTWLIENDKLTDEQHDAISEVMEKLNAHEYVSKHARRRSRKGKPAAEELEEEEVRAEKAASEQEEEELEVLGEEEGGAVEAEEFDLEDEDARPGTSKKVKQRSAPAPKVEEEENVADLLEDADEEEGEAEEVPELELDDADEPEEEDEKPKARAREEIPDDLELDLADEEGEEEEAEEEEEKPKKKAPPPKSKSKKADLESDLDEVDLDEIEELDADDEDEGEDEEEVEELELEDLDDDEEEKKPPPKKKR